MVNLIAEIKLDPSTHIILRLKINPEAGYSSRQMLGRHCPDGKSECPCSGLYLAHWTWNNHQAVQWTPFRELRTSLDGIDKVPKGNGMYII